MSFKAEIIADSKNEFGNRITTFVVTFPRIILAEFNTHRMLSKNSASSRAIPFDKMVKAVEENSFIPIAWQKDHKGMQGTEYFEDVDEIHECIMRWNFAKDKAINMAYEMNRIGITKQICNRLLEPFMWHTVIVTGTEWENFFALRAHKDAEIHMQKLAYMMLEAYNNSTPKQLKAGEWHVPFGDKINESDSMFSFSHENYVQRLQELKVKIATARCARVSYTVVGEEGKEHNYENDIKLHDRLLESGHFSPFEHCARAMDRFDWTENICGLVDMSYDGIDNLEDVAGWSGNFRGFIQYRKTIQGENKKDSRVNK